MSDAEEPDQKKISEQHIQMVCLMILAGVAGIYMVYWLRPVLVPFVVACFIVSGVGPILAYFEERFNVSRVVAAGMAFLFGVAVMGIFGLTISLSIIDLASNAKDYRSRVRQLVDRMDNTFSKDFFDLKLLGRDDSEFVKNPEMDGADGRGSEYKVVEGNSAEDEASEAFRSPDPPTPPIPADKETVAEQPNESPGDTGIASANSEVIDSETDAADDAAGSENTEEEVNGGDEESADPDSADPDSTEAASTDGKSTSQDTDQATAGLVVTESTPPLPDTDPVRVNSRATPVSSSRMQEATELVDAFVRDGISVVLQAFLSLVSTSIVVLIYVFFLLLGKPGYVQTGTMREIDTQIRGYLSLKTVISIGTGAVFGLALRLFGVPMALSFGVLAFLLNFIPNIGPIVASLLPIPLILLDPSGNIWWMISVILVTSTIQLISGNVVEPKLMGNSSDLHPVTILLGLMFWGMMWGIIGMFLATPITAAMKIVFERFEPTRQIANIMAGRWEGIEEELSKATSGQ